MRRIQSFIEEVTDYVLLPLALIAIIVVGSLYFYFSVGDIPREPLNNSAQAWMGRVVPFFGDVQASL